MRCNYCREYSRRGDFEVREREGEREELNLTSRKFCKLSMYIIMVYTYVRKIDVNKCEDKVEIS